MPDLEVFVLNGGRAMPVGSKPPSLLHQFLDMNGDPYDMTGVWNGQARAEQLHVEDQPAGVGGGNVTVDANNATVRYDWADADYATEGRFRLILWVGDGTNRFGSVVYEWHVADAPGADPTV